MCRLISYTTNITLNPVSRGEADRNLISKCLVSQLIFEKMLGLKKCLGLIKFGFWSERIQDLKNFGSARFLVKKNLGPKKCSIGKHFGSKFFESE